MTVKELRLALNQFDDDAQVILSKDGEGNGFSPLADFCLGEYKPDCTWSGDFNTHNPEGTRRLHPKRRNALCLWPTN